MAGVMDNRTSLEIVRGIFFFFNHSLFTFPPVPLTAAQLVIILCLLLLAQFRISI